MWGCIHLCFSFREVFAINVYEWYFIIRNTCQQYSYQNQQKQQTLTTLSNSTSNHVELLILSIPLQPVQKNKQPSQLCIQNKKNPLLFCFHCCCCCCSFYYFFVFSQWLNATLLTISYFGYAVVVNSIGNVFTRICCRYLLLLLFISCYRSNSYCFCLFISCYFKRCFKSTLFFHTFASAVYSCFASFIQYCQLSAFNTWF